MKYALSDLVDLPQLERLMQCLYQVTGMPYGLVDNDCKPLVVVGWADICTKFHRVNPTSFARCIESDRFVITNAKNAPYAGHKCPQGLLSYATPLIIEGEHVANVFAGQVLNGEPDTDFFQKQAKDYGFDEPSYMEALRKVRILPKEHIEAILAFLVQLAQMLASNGLKRLRQLEAEEKLRGEVEERRRAEDSARSFAERSNRLTQRIVNLQEEEQERIARELHDRVSSTLSLIGIELSNLEKQLPDVGTAEVIRDKLSDCAALVQDAVASTRDITADLHPAILNYSGLLAALEDLGHKFSSRSDIAVDVNGSGYTVRLPASKKLALFRIVQEALVNCAKHSLATNVTITLRSTADGFGLVIQDDGLGFDLKDLGEAAEESGLGLLSMRERASAIGGICRVESAPGKGTQVIVELPIRAPMFEWVSP